MTGWTAIVPIKPGATRKTRLLGLTNAQRIAVTERMLGHVLAILAAHPCIGQTTTLAAQPTRGFRWIRDEGRGLNAELDAARLALSGDILVVHADLPLLAPEDVAALIMAAEQKGAAMAPDRHGTGTNAIALKAGVDFRCRFGPDSRHRHGEAFSAMAILDRRGLALDVDTLDDLHLSGLMLRPDVQASVRMPHQDP
jgi:2-phospho-L-lactate/phosphoenolpyruvate guanylyltransferase